jgi:hypothetical protein
MIFKTIDKETNKNVKPFWPIMREQRNLNVFTDRFKIEIDFLAQHYDNNTIDY